MNVTNGTIIRRKKKEVFLESLSRGMSITQACKAADVGRVTLWRWRKESRRFNNKVLAILDSRTQVVEDALYKAALDGNITAQIFWLKNRAKDRWADIWKQDIEGEIKVKFEDV